MTPDKRASGAGFQVLLKGACARDLREHCRRDQLPWSVKGGRAGSAGVVGCEPLPQVARHADIEAPILFGLQDVNEPAGRRHAPRMRNVRAEEIYWNSVSANRPERRNCRAVSGGVSRFWRAGRSAFAKATADSLREQRERRLASLKASSSNHLAACRATVILTPSRH